MTWGKVFLIPANEVPGAMLYLDHREKGGYTQKSLDVFCSSPLDESVKNDSDTVVHAMVYMGTPDNVDYAGEEAPELTASIIAKSVGPSGPNPEYLFHLADALHAIDIQDPHIDDLVKRVKDLSSSC